MTSSARVAFVTVLLLGSRPALSQDLVGVFFDTNGESTSYITSVENEIVSLYLTILAPSASGPIEDFVGTVSFVSEGSVVNWNAAPVSGCSTAWVCPTAYLYCAEPLSPSSVVVVLEYTVEVPSPATTVEAYLRLNEVEGPFYMVAGSDEQIRLNPVSGSFDGPAAVINAGAVAAAGSSWGTLKSIYR